MYCLLSAGFSSETNLNNIWILCLILELYLPHANEVMKAFYSGKLDACVNLDTKITFWVSMFTEGDKEIGNIHRKMIKQAKTETKY